MLVAVIEEHPREIARLETVNDIAAGGGLREEPDPADLANEEVHPDGDRPIEKIGFGERELIIACAISLLR